MRCILLVAMIALSLLAHAQADDNPTYTITKKALSTCLDNAHFASGTLEMRFRGESLNEAIEIVRRMDTPEKIDTYLSITREMHHIDLPRNQHPSLTRPFIQGIFNHQVARCIADQ